MKTFFLYCYYRLYQWSVKRDENIPMFLTVAWTTFTLFSNVVAILAIITICTGLDAISILSIPKAKYEGAVWLGVWGVFVWLMLKFFHVHEKAFSDEMKRRYEKMGCKGWWVVAYYFVSYILMGVTGWFAGARLGMH